MTEAKWRDFETQWARYNRSFGVSGLGDSLEAIVEKDMMAAIKRMAVLVSNLMVHRNQMRDHRQGE